MTVLRTCPPIYDPGCWTGHKKIKVLLYYGLLTDFIQVTLILLYYSLLRIFTHVTFAPLFYCLLINFKTYPIVLWPTYPLYTSHTCFLAHFCGTNTFRLQGHNLAQNSLIHHNRTYHSPAHWGEMLWKVQLRHVTAQLREGKCTEKLKHVTPSSVSVNPLRRTIKICYNQKLAELRSKNYTWQLWHRDTNSFSVLWVTWSWFQNFALTW